MRSCSPYLVTDGYDRLHRFRPHGAAIIVNAPTTSSAVVASGSPILIGIADRELAQALAQVVAELGCEAHCPASLDELMAAAARLQPLLVLVGSWPELAALELCHQLRSAAPHQNTPIVLVGAAGQIDRGALFAAGAADYLLLPLEPAEALARIRLHLDRSRLDRLHERARNLTLFRGPALLAASLQKRLRRQAELLQEQLFLLDREVRERRQMESALRDEQSRTQKLLLNVLPQAIVDRLAREDGLAMENEILADRFEEATILFADIVDFTPLSVQLPPLELVQLLNRIFSAFDRLAEEFGLEKIKTIGDAYMVAGGIPVPRPDHALTVMEMAIAMRREINQLRRETGLPLALRIGINTGAVVAGVIGIKKFSYDLWGDTVNVASRMESQGIPGKIQVTEATYAYLKDHYEFERWSNLPVKGRGRMTAYLYVRRRSSPWPNPEANSASEETPAPVPHGTDSGPSELRSREPTPEIAL